MATIVAEIAGRVLIEAVAVVITESIRAYGKQRRCKKAISSLQKQTRVPVQHDRAVLIASSNITFGNDCERLVNIAFQTSQTFPTIMGTYADVHQYLRQELAKQHPDQSFNIIIGANESFGCAVDDGQYFAEVQQDRYRVLIFTTSQNSQVKWGGHSADSQISLVWN